MISAPPSLWFARAMASATREPLSRRHGEREKGAVRMLGDIRLPRSSIRASIADCETFEPWKLIEAV
jgi:hypothetical protein